ncbi:MAG: hypothetical protein KDC26_05395 [Armatimonadetes bacterium]|nr:hypothetical protein [Armatimonadota bacterium]
MVLDQEIRTYHEQMTALLPHAGKFVLIKGSSVLGIYENLSDALTTGHEKLGFEPFFVREIRPDDPIEKAGSLHLY